MKAQDVFVYGFGLVSLLILLVFGLVGFSIVSFIWGCFYFFFPNSALGVSSPNIFRIRVGEKKPVFISTRETYKYKLGNRGKKWLPVILRLNGIIAFAGAFSLYTYCQVSGDMLCHSLLFLVAL